MYTREEVERFRNFGNVTDNGVVFDWGLAGSEGAVFVLLREPHHTNEDIAKAKALIRRDRDIVWIRVERIPA